MGHLTNDEFFTKLISLFTTHKSKSTGAIYLTQKRQHRSSKVKLSTVVQPDELDAFYLRYAEVCRAGMGALKPRDRTKGKRKAKAAKKRKGGAAPVA
ncbi:hypothetical protein N0V88_006128 [Collariella sp. IMI 366227]|nr:hypothetical protein N0V88_006128 [Collariella sp. IMI 366227]